MKKKIALYCCLWLVVSCVTSSGVTKTPTPQEQEAQQKQALKARITTTMAEQNRRIDSLIAAKDPRLKKDKNGNYIRPNWVSTSGRPLYYSTNKRSARKAIKADAVNTGGNLGLNLNGEGIHLGIWDAGHIFTDHEAFTGGADYFGYQVPIEIADSSTANVWDGHPTAVASIVIAKGILENENYDITGIAPSLDKVYSYDWENDITEIFEQLQTDNNPDFILSNHSYGIPLMYDGELLPDEFIGDYSEWSSFLDNITYAYPYYVHIAAGGNDGNVSYPTQEVTGLDQLTGSTTAKNVLTVGSFSMDDNSENFTPTGFSSAGPTNDFRIKPEITAPGQHLGAAYWDENNPDFTDFYVVTSGTSFAAPATAGGIALLQQLYKRIHNTYMRGATVKALLCHTAQDIVVWSGQDITGPDVKTGYGAINIAAAASIIEQDETATNTLLEFQLLEGETKTLYITILEEGALKATLSWYDPHAPKDATNTLINDLDLRITQEDTTYFPWKLPTTDTQQAVAIKGDNAADNLEQVSIRENLGGIYEIAISHKGTLQGGTQQASLVLTGPGVIIPSKTALENASIDGFLVTPNPVNERFSVAVLDNSLSFRSLQLIDMSGREVARTSKASFSRASLFFEVAFLPKGVYILGIETKKNTTFKQIVIY